jgi:hypothetical protein
MGKRTSRPSNTNPQIQDGRRWGVTDQPPTLPVGGPDRDVDVAGSGGLWPLALFGLVCVGAALAGLWFYNLGAGSSASGPSGRAARTLRFGEDKEPAADPDAVWRRIEAQLRQQNAGKPKWVPPAWEPKSDEDKLVDRFVKLRQKGDPAAFGLLANDPQFTDKPVPEADAERLHTDYFLRAGELKIVAVYAGEPDGSGGQSAAPHRYTLVTKGGVATPPHAIAQAGRTDPPSQRIVSNPELVLDVKGGKIVGVRTELPR